MVWILLVGLVLLCAGVVMVLSAAFRFRVAWGVAILLMPLIYPLYAVLHWSESRPRNGFLLSIVGLLVASVALYGGAGRDVLALVSGVPSEQVQSKVQELVEKVPTAAPPDEPLPNEAKAAKVSGSQAGTYDPILGDDEFAFQKIEPLPPREDKRVQVTAPAVRYEFQQVVPALASHFHGTRARLTTKAGELKEGVLRGSHVDSVVMEIPFQGGVAAFEFPFSDIDRLSVYEARGAVAALTPPEPVPGELQAQEMQSGEVQGAQPEAAAPVEVQVAQPEAAAPVEAQAAQPEAPVPVEAGAAQPKAPAPVEPQSAQPLVSAPGGQAAGPPGATAPDAPQWEGVAAPVPAQGLPRAAPQAPTDPGQTGVVPPVREILEESPAPAEPAAEMESASVQTPPGGAELAPRAVSDPPQTTEPGLPRP
jgi:hypothetical protein